MLKKFSLLLLVFAVFLGSCDTDSDADKNTDPPEIPPIVNFDDLEWGNEYYPDWLVLTPGADATELMLNWLSEKPSPGAAAAVSKVRTYSETDDYQEVTGTVQAISAPATYKGFNVNKVTVPGLVADRGYRYWVSADGENWSKEYSFRTPKTDVFRFAALSDPQVTAVAAVYLAWQQTLEKVAQANVSFIASSGDQVDTLAVNMMEYNRFFEPPQLRSIPYAPAVGNHDRHYPFTFHFNMPNEMVFQPLKGEGSEYGSAQTQEHADIEAVANYWYRYNNCLFVVLNTSAAPQTETAAEPLIQRFDETLTAAKTANPGYTWLFVQQHKSTTSVANHCADIDVMRYVETGLEQLMTTHGVDFVFSGHDHTYTRSYPMTGKKGGAPSVPDKTQGGDTINNPNGTIYFTLTTACGVKFYDAFSPERSTNMNYPYLADGSRGAAGLSASNMPVAVNVQVHGMKPGYVIVDVQGNTVTFNAYHLNETTPIDSLTVTK